MTTPITLYGQPNCHPCRIAQSLLDREAVPYTYVDLSTRPDLVDAFRQAGKPQTPILQTPTATTSGFAPAAYAAAIAEARATLSAGPVPAGPGIAPDTT